MFPLLVMAVMVLASSCAKAPILPSATVRVAVLDGRMAPESAETRRSVTGWWFGARDRFDNGNAGLILADAMAEEIDTLTNVRVHPRVDMKTYMAHKERLLARAYPDMTPEQRREVLMDQSPVDFGRSLNVDDVLSSRIDQARLVHQRTFHWWYSKVGVDVELWSVDEERVVWSWQSRDTDAFSSTVPMLEEAAREVRRALGKSGALAR